MPKLIDLSDQHFGRWMVLKKIGGSRANGAFWVCRCDCGTIKKVNSRSLRNGQSQSCGCLQAEGAAKRIISMNKRHGLSSHRTHKAWCGLKQRCLNPNNPAWARYGGRGIRACDRWRDSFDDFLKDMGLCPAKHELDRINNDGPYSPENCRWASSKTQQNNRSSNRTISWRGQTRTLQQWARKTGINRTTIAARLDNGWSISRVLETTTS